MSLKLDSHTTISGFDFTFINQFEINSSWENLTDVATITIPKKLVYKRNGVRVDNITEGTNPVFKRGDAVTIRAGYDGKLTTRFNGFLSEITPRLPLKFECQDSLWKLKQVTVNKFSEKNVTLKSLLTAIMPADIPFTALDFTLGLFRVQKATVAEVLDYLKKTYGIVSYFRDGTLVSGFAYITTDPLQLKIIPFQLDSNADNKKGNVVDDTNLIYKKEDDVKIKVKAISIHPDNTRTEVDRGDEDGELRTLHFYDVSEAELKRLADEKISRLKYEGWRGSFTAFIEPEVKHGNAVKIKSLAFPEKDGIYLVKGVRTSVGVTEGGRQVITLDTKIS